MSKGEGGGIHYIKLATTDFSGNTGTLISITPQISLELATFTFQPTNPKSKNGHTYIHKRGNYNLGGQVQPSPPLHDRPPQNFRPSSFLSPRNSEHGTCHNLGDRQDTHNRFFLDNFKVTASIEEIGYFP